MERVFTPEGNLENSVRELIRMGGFKFLPSTTKINPLTRRIYIGLPLRKLPNGRVDCLRI